MRQHRCFAGSPRISREQAVSVVLTSADGLVLDRIAPDSKIERMLDDVRLARGYSYAEEFAGTNGIGTALETGQPAFIQGSEHYVGTLGDSRVRARPIREPVTRRILGVIDSDLLGEAGRSAALRPCQERG